MTTISAPVTRPITATSLSTSYQGPAQPVLPPLGTWNPDGISAHPILEPSDIKAALRDIKRTLYVVRTPNGLALARSGNVIIPSSISENEAGLPLVGFVNGLSLESLGAEAFRADHGLKFAYVAGAMAKGIASVEIVEAMARAGCLGFFGAAGLSPALIERAIDRLNASIGNLPCGFNLIHSPSEPKLEAEVVELYLRRGVNLVEASAYLDLTLPVVKFRVMGIHKNAEGKIVTPHKIVAKVSRVEVASKFFAPPPEKFLKELVSSGAITQEQAALAAQIPMAQDLTAEADSAGHTDNRPALCLLPSLLALRDRFQEKYQYPQRLRVGAAGGISTPASVAAAFAMGAAYVVTGSVNQACVESGSSDGVRKMLAQADQADVAMAPAADMFEMGVKVQVLKRGTMFAMRATKLFELYRTYESMDALPAAEREALEKNFFRAPLEQIWQQTKSYFLQRDKAQADRAEKDLKHRMALVFRWYLGMASNWANQGEPSRQMDYQVWCGPAMGAFNEWTKGSALEKPENRKAAVVAHNLLMGAAVLTRANMLRGLDFKLPADAEQFRPEDESAIQSHI